MTASETLKRLCDRVWHEKLWGVMQKIIIEKSLVQVIEVSAGLPGNQIGFDHLAIRPVIFLQKRKKKPVLPLPLAASYVGRI